MEETFYLFGSTACNVHFDAGVKGVIESGCDFGTFWFIDGQSKSWELIDAFDGWGEYRVITKDEYFYLEFGHKAQVGKVGTEPDTSIAFLIKDDIDRIFIYGVFYGDTFEITDCPLYSPEETQFAEDWHEQIQNFLLERFPAEERK